MTPNEIALKLVSCIESDNGARQGSFLKWLKPEYREKLMADLESGIEAMQIAGCAFTQEQIELMAMGEQGEAQETFMQFNGYIEAKGVNQALNTIFDPEREMVTPR